VLASAVQSLFPEVKLGIGPAIAEGFYYDFYGRTFIPEDLAAIEKKMQEIISRREPFIAEQWSKEQAARFFNERGERFKAELIRELPDEKVSIYRHGKFTDLCRGPHLASTDQINAFKLLSISAAYWKADQNNAALQRIYGTAFFSREELAAHLKKIEEAKERDHRVLGKKLELFDLYQEEAGAGFVFYHPHGAQLLQIIEDWETKEHLKRGYQLVSTPHLMNVGLWKTSGHAEYYREYMYFIQSEEQEFVLKPMNCPGHILIYKSRTRSYKDLPLRFFELGTVYRREKSGVLHGLLRVRGFTQDDAHIFCREQDLNAEITGVVEFVKSALRRFGFEEFEAELSTRPASFIGREEQWSHAETVLSDALKSSGIDFSISKGEGAFYGPKIDFKLKDILGRKWQCATIQLDYALPERFGLEYITAENTRQRPIMIHRVILGSLERFIATLIEHYKGEFPVWLAPVQVKILTVNAKAESFAEEVKKNLAVEGIRAESDYRDDTLAKKIRAAEQEKVPYIAVIGEKELSQKSVALRKRHRENLGTLGIADFIGLIKKEVGISGT
jgi:threonyl-tRNA synthetase